MGLHLEAKLALPLTSHKDDKERNIESHNSHRFKAKCLQIGTKISHLSTLEADNNFKVFSNERVRKFKFHNMVLLENNIW